MFGGDGCSPFVHRCEHKRSVVTMSAKFANVIPEYRLKRCNTILLSVFEGKESYEVLKSPMKFIMKSTKNFENQGYFCAKKGEYNVYETHLAGDEKFLNVLCGLKSCSAAHFCARCTHQRGGKWSTCGQERKFEELPRQPGQESPALTKISSTRVHFCALHCKLAFLKKFVMSLVRIAVEKSSSMESEKAFQLLQKSFVELTKRFGKTLKHIPREEILAFLSMFRVGFDPRATDEKLLSTLMLMIKEARKNFKESANAKLSRSTKLSMNDSTDDENLLIKLQKKFYQWRISTCSRLIIKIKFQW